ncbi:4'-phosphopantetheinyl transferase [Pararhodobacter sp. CCB-MM2]|uniref:4'-phosphopantetheinyl transferase family protein n=1 Tax=Pararhodobacter sp. CCB-MM2 TaxID=1786003 RepID=UPI00082B3F11|nr:4'-phosphopantetheinyl transferase superfamily protein [Pararhodobacter sp. CCB-MM2]
MSLTDDQITRRQLTGLAARVFPGLSVGIAPIGPVALMGPEAEAMARAVPSRVAEFSAGRAAARIAMGREVAIPMGADRAPIWPEGIRGSITHAGSWALAVTGQGMIGADLELDEDLPDEVRDTVLLPEERGADARQARLIFSAKECVYKAQYPVTRQLFGFETFAVTLGDGTYRATWQRDVGPFRAGQAIEGRFAMGGGFLLTGTG